MRNKFFVLLLVLFFVPVAQAAEGSRQGKSRLGIAVPYLVSQLEPLAINEPVTKLILSNIAHSLFRFEGKGLVADLASGYNSPDGGKTWEVVLPQAVAFADGSSLRGTSIVDLYQFFADRARQYLEKPSEMPQGIPEQLLQQLANIDSISTEVREVGSIRALEQEIVTFKLRKSDEQFRRCLVLPILDMRIVESFAEKKLLGTNITGLGAFNLAARSADQEISLSKVSGYFRPGLPQLNTVEIRQTVDAEQALSALRVGSVDIILLPTKKILTQVEKDPTLIAVDSPLSNLRYPSASWQLLQNYWSDNQDSQDQLVLQKIVIRKSLSLDQATLTRLDLSNVYLP